MSQALLDRFDIQINMIPESEEIVLSEGGDRNEFLLQREQINRARLRMRNRQEISNSYLKHDVLSALQGWQEREKSVLAKLARANLLSNRAMIGAARLARTIADLDDREKIREEDVLEAMHFRAPLKLE